MPEKLANTNSIQNNHHLLSWVHRSQVFKDSKTFVDMSIKSPPEDILKSFEALLDNSNLPTKDIVENFISTYFQHTGEFQEWIPEDFDSEPKFLSQIQDDNLKEFAQSLVKIWPTLARKVRDEVFQNRTNFSLIPVPNGFIIPGGRFKEIYYWDTLWIVEGLLICDMTTTVRGILDNFLHMVDSFGFIPNGSRVYYLSRSQPPVLTLMVEEYMNKTNDDLWLKENLPIIAKELNYWLSKFTTIEQNGEKFQLCQYKSETSTPRPESFGEDIITADVCKTNEDKERLYNEIRSAAESGWDFSSRWIFDSETNDELFKIQPSRLIPVDLNAILCRCFELVGNYYEKFGDHKNSDFWKQKSKDLQVVINELLYNKEDGTWYDYDIKTKSQRKRFYASNLTPLWTESFDVSLSAEYGEKALKYLRQNGILDFPGGIPCSLVASGQQWDFPNVWPPLQSIVTVGLHKSKNLEAQEVAKKLAYNYVHSNMQSFKDSGMMFEKYDARHVGKYGGGGEYITQTGFGWSNGVVLSFIKRFNL